MMKTDTQQLWTIGHSTRSLEHFAEMLQSFDIEIIVDVRSFPRSRKYPQFNKENLEISLPEKNMQYTHLKLLGGRRPVKKILKIQVGNIPHFVAMQIIWKRMLLKMEWKN